MHLGTRALPPPMCLVHRRSHSLYTSVPLPVRLCLDTLVPLASVMIVYSSSKV